MKALALFSGGLDSILAIKLIQEQGIDVIALSFISPFFGNIKKLRQIAKANNINLKTIDITADYIKLVKNPKHGYGKNMNPCIDCKILMLKKAKQHAKKLNAKFIFTGEVLGQRPMSQHDLTLKTIEKEAGLKGQLLRPLSAKFLPQTVAEKTGLINRDKLLAIKGRTRKEQLKLSKKYKIKSYTSPGGGCLLTYEAYANKLKDLINHKKKPSLIDVKLLKIGRHFRAGKNKIIVGRNKQDNEQLLKLKNKSDYVCEAVKVMGPTTLLQGPKTKKAIFLAAQLTARYSDAKEKKVKVKYNKRIIEVKKILDKELEKLRI